MKKLHFSILTCLLCLLSLSLEASSKYQLTTETKLNFPDSTDQNLYFSQRIDYQIEVNRFSPINQQPQEIILRLLQVKSALSSKQDSFTFDSEIDDENLQTTAILKLIDTPIRVQLDSNCAVVKPIADFDELVKKTAHVNSFLGDDLIQLLVHCAVTPSKQSGSLSLPLSIQTVEIETPFKMSGKVKLCKISQPITLPFLMDQDQQNKGHLSGEIKAMAKGGLNQRCFLKLESNPHLSYLGKPVYFEESVTLLRQQ